MEKRIYRLVHATARARAASDCATAPDGWIVVVSPQKRSLDQNALIHAELQEVGDALGWKWNGFAVDLDDMKTIFVAAFRKATNEVARVLPGIDGHPVLLGWRTRDFSRREGSDFIDMLRAWRIENGI